MSGHVKHVRFQGKYVGEKKLRVISEKVKNETFFIPDNTKFRIAQKSETVLNAGLF